MESLECPVGARSKHQAVQCYSPFRNQQVSVVAHPFNLSTQETEPGRSLSSRSAWTTEQVPGQPGLHKETLSQEQNKTNKQKNKKTSKLC